MRVAVIGGGPSGLVTLKYLSEAHHTLGCEPVCARLFEYQPTIGGAFVSRTYEEAELVSSKQLTTFSDFRCPAKEDFLTAAQYVAYLNDYATEFDLWPHIRLRTKVTAIKRTSGGGHRITYLAEDSRLQEHWECDAVAVCSGLHVEPNTPDIRGINSVPLAIHSSNFKSRKQLEDKTVLVLGSGETGADIAYLAATSRTKRVVMCHRDGFHFAPKRNPGPVVLPLLGRKPDPAEPGIPIDVSRANLFDTTYVHPVLRNHMILWDYYYYYIKTLLWLCSGTTAGMDQWIGEISRERHHPSKIFFNKSSRVCPYISLPYRPKLPGYGLWIYSLRSALIQTPVPETNGRQVDLAPWPTGFDGRGVVQFTNNGRPEYDRMKGEEVKPDIVIFCTGYKQSFPFLTSGGTISATYPSPSSADVRGIWKRDDPTVGFIGFIRPSFGAIPPLAEMQAQLWIVNLLSTRKIPRELRPEDEPHYRLHHPSGSRITYGVDHESYTYQLALDMDSAPGAWDVVRLMFSVSQPKRWRLPIIWALGAHFNSKFRLKGPWKRNDALQLLTSDEFWHTITRRPLIFGHFAVSILPMAIFGPLSLAVYLYLAIVDVLGRLVVGIAGLCSSSFAAYSTYTSGTADQSASLHSHWLAVPKRESVQPD